MLTLYLIAFAPTQKSERKGLLFTRLQNNGDLGAISVTDLESGASLIGWVLCHTLVQCEQVTVAVHTI